MDDASIVFKYFPALSEKQSRQFLDMGTLYEKWNAMINVISRKDMEHFYERHVLHSLVIAKFREFKEGEKVMDVGTGGGFPSIPLAILFPGTTFLAIDSIGKKIKVVDAVSKELGLSNVIPLNTRVENVKEKVDFVVSRAAASFNDLVKWTRQSIEREGGNGIIALKGGDLKDELKGFRKAEVYPVSTYYNESFFESKMLVFLPA